MGREEEIRLIAYSIWEQEGYCDGHEIDHWLRAEVIWEKNQKKKGAFLRILKLGQSALLNEVKNRPAHKRR
jgi:hypothetical protein